MVLAHTTYSLLLALAGIIAGLVAVMIYVRRRATPSAPSLLAFMFALSWWDFTYALYWSDLPSPSPTFWLDATFLGVVVAPPAFFAFALQYTRQGQVLSRNKLALLSVVPVLTLAFLWTDPWHNLFFSQPRDTARGTILSGGPLFWASFVYLYSLNLAAVILLIRAFRGAPPLYRKQARIVLLGGLVPWITNFVSVVGLNPLPEIDLTPLAFTLTGILLAYGLFFYRLLDIVPVARDMLIEHMLDGVMVLDAKGRVVDINLAACRIFGVASNAHMGQPVSSLLADYPQLAEYVAARNIPETIQITREEPAQVLDIRIVVLPSQTKQPTGHLVVIRDIIEQVRAEAEIRAANDHLRLQLVEIERLRQELHDQVIHDSLTGLFNRLFFEETLQRELARTDREHHPTALILLDVDYFKQINDKYGHTAGDIMLQALGQLLQSQVRSGDVVCRYGGEEFAIVLPGASAMQAAQRIEELREKVSNLLVHYNDHELRATISAGVAEYPQDGTTRDQLLRAADNALYRSKHLGRNRVTLSSTAEPAVVRASQMIE